jgi:L-aspartate oxidase
MKTDFLVIGSGIAGLNFAIKTAKYGNVTVVTKKETIESNTNYAQGGIACVMSSEDSFQSHLEDTLKAGCGLSDRRMVEILVKNGPKEIDNLTSLGVEFDSKNGKLILTSEGGHTKSRVLHVGDHTGKELERNLALNVKENKDIITLEDHFAIDLISKDKVCYGARVLDVKKKDIVDIYSKVTALATGGIGRVYKITSNPDIATGDGIAMAYRAGARIEDMEFVQFHPTTLNLQGAPHFLITEAMRGEGAILISERGRRFVDEKSTRDVVARAIFNMLKKGQVYLDARHLGSKYLKKRFPTIYDECLKYGIDVTKDPIPVSPAAHYLCGGIKINEYGETNIKNLLAFGECACSGVHGANRLASNSLLESLVFSSLGAEKAKKYVEKSVQEIKQKDLEICNGKELKNLEKELRSLMWENVGIVRNEKNLTYNFIKLKKLEKILDDYFKNGISMESLELRNMALTGKLITKTALIRAESRGAHYREDFPNTDDYWLKHIYFEKGLKGELCYYIR